MHRFLFLVVLLTVCMPMFAQREVTLPVSADGEATLTAFLPAQPAGRAIVAIPGGGYRSTSIGNNAQWAPLYNEMGISYFILKYRMPQGDPSVPISDAETAMRIVRDSAARWGVNPSDVGMMGTSAGGHLVTLMATTAPEAVRPDFQILFYPVITFGEGCHKGSRDNFLGRDTTDVAKVAFYSTQNRVSETTPPAILFANSDDRGVPPASNSVPYYLEMTKNGCNATLHIYPEGGHGWTFRSPFRYHDQVVSELTAWLRALPSR